MPLLWSCTWNRKQKYKPTLQILKFRDYLNEKPFQLKIVSAAFAGHAAETQNDVYA